MEPSEFWTVFWSAASSIATFAAVLVALWQTRYSYKKKLRIEYSDNVKMAIPGHDDFLHLISVKIMNVGNKNVNISQIALRLGEKKLLVFLPQLFKYAPITLPKLLEPETACEAYMELDLFIENLKKCVEDGDTSPYDKICFQIVDSTSKIYLKKLKKTYGHYLESVVTE